MFSSTVRRFVIVSLALTLATSWASAEDPKQDKPAKPAAEHKQPKAEGEHAKLTCAVTDEPADMKSFTVYRGKRVYFCCDDCIKPFKEDPDKYAAAVKAQWEALKPMRVQTVCPVTGEPVKHEQYVSTPDFEIFFASEEAKKTWEKDSSKYASKMDECFTFQTTCPVSGKEIDPTASDKLDGRMVYFCCPNCPAAAKKDTAATLKKVDEVVAANKKAWEAHKKP